MATETLRPTGAGTTTAIESQYPNSTSHYDKVDEEVSDDDATYVYMSGTSTTEVLDTYATADTAIPAGSTINSVTVYVLCRSLAVWDESNLLWVYGQGRPALRSGGTNYYGTLTTFTDSYVLYSKTWTTNPATSANWDVSELNALQAGVALKTNRDFDIPREYAYPRCTQVYMVVDYTLAGGARTDRFFHMF
jgi:hypothetical protein